MTVRLSSTQGVDSANQLPVYTGGDVKVVQELMRHAKISTTMEVYAQAGMEKKRLAQRRAVDVLMDRKPKNATDERAKRESSQIVPAESSKFPEVAA
jgi:hypothetical protein